MVGTAGILSQKSQALHVARRAAFGVHGLQPAHDVTEAEVSDLDSIHSEPNVTKLNDQNAGSKENNKTSRQTRRIQAGPQLHVIQYLEVERRVQK